MLNLDLNRSFKRRTTIRLSFSECASGMCTSRVRSAMTVGTIPHLAGACGLYAFHEEGFDGISDLEIIVIVNADTAFISAGHLRHVVLEALQRSDLAFEYHHVIAQQSNL